MSEPDSAGSDEAVDDADADSIETDEAVTADAVAGDEATDDETDDKPELDPLGVAEADRDGYLNDLQRLKAEFANFRKQVNKRNAEVWANAAADLVEKLLPVLDACDAAIQQGATDVEPIRATLRDNLGKEGLEVHDPTGEPFDPEQHEAVMTEDGDGESTVVEVLRTGYGWKGRVIRPAMVKVRG